MKSTGSFILEKLPKPYKRIGTPKSIRKRVDNPNHLDWYRLRPKRTC